MMIVIINSQFSMVMYDNCVYVVPFLIGLVHFTMINDEPFDHFDTVSIHWMYFQHTFLFMIKLILEMELLYCSIHTVDESKTFKEGLIIFQYQPYY